jgi:hypothetical protein
LEYKKRVRIVSLAELVLAVLLLLFPSVLQGFPFPDVETLLLYFLGFVSFIMLIFPPPPPQQNKSELSDKKEGGRSEIEMVSSIACHGGCPFVQERLLKRGDYIMKSVGSCPRCSGELYVKTIYAVEEKQVD